MVQVCRKNYLGELFRSMLNQFQKFGRTSESIAAKVLKKKGYKILEKNYRSPGGEIDIIAKDKDTLVFVEVKARMSETYGNPKESVTIGKQQKISKTAQYYFKEKKLSDFRARFDVVAINKMNGKLTIEVLQNAFEYRGPE